MAGPYRTTFNFIEVLGFAPDFVPDAPYQSWATEYVFVLENQPRYISLQHIMVMEFETDEGKSEPMVMKHWRQDWTYEDRDLLVYAGDDTFRRERLPTAEVRGAWSQAVYQVDDSPRYEAVGRWRHEGNLSTWQSNRTWRPLPRREHSVRGDYQVLDGFNRHTILPTGWVHEEENWKRVLGGEEATFVAKEIGVNRYDRITGFDFEPGRRYLEATGPFWAAVRDRWRELERAGDGLVLKSPEGKPSMFAALFQEAVAYVAANDKDARQERIAAAATLIESYVDVLQRPITDSNAVQPARNSGTDRKGG